MSQMPSLNPTNGPTLSPTLAPTTTLVETNCYTLTMKDEGADGWEKAYWYWKNGDSGDSAHGNVIASGTMEDGATSTTQICAYTRVSCYDFVVTDGLDPSEVSWTIKTLTGSNIFDMNSAKGKGGAGANVTFCSMPTSQPTSLPSPRPSPVPSRAPSPMPTPIPTPQPSPLPTASPRPTPIPSSLPSPAPPTAAPSFAPTPLPSYDCDETAGEYLYKLTLTDTSGDGWNNVTYTISTNGTARFSNMLEDGDSGLRYFCLEDNVHTIAVNGSTAEVGGGVEHDFISFQWYHG